MSEKEKTFKLSLKGKSANTAVNGGGGGGGNSGKTTSTYSTITNMPSTVATPIPQSTQTKEPIIEKHGHFDDLDSVSWAVQAINALADKGIIKGKGERLFAPADDITRAEFATIIVNAFGILDENAECNALSDVSAGDWYYKYIASAYNNQIISGYNDGKFGVNDKITRQDMAVIIYRAMNSLGISIEESEEEIEFADSDLISDYAKEAVKQLQKADIINGVGNAEFAPLMTATRAQAAQMIYNTQEYTK